jgi:hypothetical protein
MVIFLAFENNYTLDSRFFVVKFHHLATKKKDYELLKRGFWTKGPRSSHFEEEKVKPTIFKT